MIRNLSWTAVGILFMTGNITPVGKVLWIGAAAIAAVMIFTGARSPRYLFLCVTGIGATLICLALVNSTYVLMLLYGSVLVAAGIVGFAAFGPRTSKADGPETFPDS